MSDLVEDNSSSSQQYSTAASHTSALIDETDSGSDDHHKLHQRWMSEDTLSEDSKLVRRERGSHSSSSPPSAARRTRSIRSTRSLTQKSRALTKQNSYEEVAGYATLPRASRAKTKKKPLWYNLRFWIMLRPSASFMSPACLIFWLNLVCAHRLLNLGRLS